LGAEALAKAATWGLEKRRASFTILAKFRAFL
jgi:hypothetical protein